MEQTAEKLWESYSADGKGEASAEKEAWQKTYDSNYLQPSKEEIDTNSNIGVILRQGEVALVVPMKEEGSVARPLLSRVSQQMPGKNIVVINDRSDKEAVTEVTKHNVPLIDRDDILDALDWNRLLPILNLDERPYGKGMSVLAGYLHHYVLSQIRDLAYQPIWLAQHDAELSLESKHHNLEYLMWALLKNENHRTTHHVKVAKYGRGNERVMVIRNSLLELEYLPQSQENILISKRAKELFANLSGYKWILSGQFLLDWQTAMNRPFATGYLEETLTCAYAEDVASSNKFLKSVQVANPNPCVGGVNGHCKENIILQIASNFVLTLAMIVKPIDKWRLKDISRINHRFMSRTRPMALIPSDEGPVRALNIPQERIIPSVKTLIREGFVDMNVATQVAKRTIS